MTLGLRARASLAVLVLVLALVALASVVTNRADGALLSVERARFEAATAQLADAVRYGVLAKSEVLLADPLDAFAQNPDLGRVVVRADGAVLAARTGGTRVPAHAGVTVTVKVETRGRAPGDDGELAAFGVAAGGEPRVIGEVEAVFSNSATAEIAARTRRQIVLATLGTGFVGLLGATLLMTSVVRRVRAIADAAARVRAGHRNVAVPVAGSDELSQLGADFNAMTRALDEAATALAERESLAAIGRATAVIAHEIRNPLGIVLGAAQIVGNDRKPMAARIEAAGLIEHEVRRLSSTLDDLLTYARPRVPRRLPVELRAACDEAALRAQTPGGPLEHGEVFVEGVAAWALADADQLQQVLLNLVQNAAQAGARRVTLAVVASGARGQGVVGVRVRDDGPGVPTAIRHQLFMPFATTKQRGTGLGLAASRRMARDNGGDLAHVVTDTGATFLLTLCPVGPPQETT